MAPEQYVFTVDIRTEGEVPVFVVAGVIDEHADLAPISSISGDAEINLKGVRRINSFGVRAWMEALRAVPGSVKLRVVECPPPVVDQLNMVGGFLAHAQLVSFYVPMTCEECDEQLDQLYELEACRKLGGKLPSTPCPRCGRPMEVDDLEEQYLLFAREQ